MLYGPEQLPFMFWCIVLSRTSPIQNQGISLDEKVDNLV
jgi:hypothetical protein